jgi:phosphate transport system permease protein
MSSEPPTPASRPVARAVPERFLASKATLRLDRFMTFAIQFGGIGIILAVFGIFIFILMEVMPLFGSAKVNHGDHFPLQLAKVQVMGSDEWAGKPFFYEGGSEVKFADLARQGALESQPLTLPAGVEVSAWNLDEKINRVALGTKDGRVGAFKISYTSAMSAKAGDEPLITASVKVEEFFPIGKPGLPLAAVSIGDGGSAKLLSAIQDVAGKPEVHVISIKEKRSLMGGAKPEVVGQTDLTPEIEGVPTTLLASTVGDSILVVNEKGVVHYFFQEGTKLVLRQKFQPFSSLPDPAISSIGYVFGDVSVVTTSADGHQEVWSLYNQAFTQNGVTEERRLYGRTKTFPPLAAPATFYAASLRNKTFLTGHGKEATLRYTTTEDVRWSQTLPFEVAHACFDAKAEHLLFLDTAGTFHRFEKHDPHPEAGWKAFFGKIWYEGASKPDYIWQSTGGTDDFESKLSLTPLIIGSLKGTLYAMLFAVPIALLAAIYSACFLPVEVKTVIKPTMEIMASLPSVVLGFLAGLWLAPLIEEKVPSLILTVISVPLGVMLCGWIWTKLPVSIRSKVPPGNEYLLLVPPMLLFAFGAWSLGPWFESWAFVVQEPGSGKLVADFRLWWPQFTGAPFDQRNSLVVGFMMGFAVIPIVFTISEDALSNVPPQLRAASLALGASRWQMVRSVVLPIASAGIFSALMIGFGRAVGETMIVVMATGNTPVMDLNIFSGMRTLSANIAVELPEAAVHSTHYRSLFLGAMMLFVMTFMLNTVAELLRQRLRDKFKLV